MILGFMHCATIGNGEKILRSQIAKVIESGLFQVTNQITIGKVGDGELSDIPNGFLVSQGEGQINHGEKFTLDMLWDVCRKTDCDVWYVHTKGASRRRREVVAWRRAMEYHIMYRHRDCIAELADHDICGILWSPCGCKPHFSGNFWWARGAYIRSLEKPSEWVSKNEPQIPEMYRYELWIGSGPSVRPKSLFQVDPGKKWYYDKEILYGSYGKLF